MFMAFRMPSKAERQCRQDVTSSGVWRGMTRVSKWAVWEWRRVRVFWGRSEKVWKERWKLKRAEAYEQVVEASFWMRPE